MSSSAVAIQRRDHQPGRRKNGANFNLVDLGKIKCFKCKKMGHFKHDCPENEELTDDEATSDKSVDLWGDKRHARC